MVSRFALMSNGQNFDNLVLCIHPVQGQVTASAALNHQLAHIGFATRDTAILYPPTYARVVLQQSRRPDNQIRAR